MISEEALSDDASQGDGSAANPDASTSNDAGGAVEASTAASTMNITFKLYATLQDLLPRGAVKNAVQIEVARDVTLYEIIDRYKVPRELAHLVLVNGVFFCDADREEKGLLKPDDVLAIWPPVAGG